MPFGEFNGNKGPGLLDELQVLLQKREVPFLKVVTELNSSFM